MIYLNKLSKKFNINPLPLFSLSYNNQIGYYNNQFDYYKIAKIEEEDLFNKFKYNIPID
jgi:hypothetical protein